MKFNKERDIPQHAAGFGFVYGADIFREKHGCSDGFKAVNLSCWDFDKRGHEVPQTIDDTLRTFAARPTQLGYGDFMPVIFGYPRPGVLYGPSAEMGHGFPVTGNVLLTAQFSNVLPFKSILQEVCGRRTCLFFRYWLQACLNARLRKLYRTTEGHISDLIILLLRENPTAFVLSEFVSHFCTEAVVGEFGSIIMLACKHD